MQYGILLCILQITNMMYFVIFFFALIVQFWLNFTAFGKNAFSVCTKTLYLFRAFDAFNFITPTHYFLFQKLCFPNKDSRKSDESLGVRKALLKSKESGLLHVLFSIFICITCYRKV